MGNFLPFLSGWRGVDRYSAGGRAHSVMQHRAFVRRWRRMAILFGNALGYHECSQKIPRRRAVPQQLTIGLVHMPALEDIDAPKFSTRQA